MINPSNKLKKAMLSYATIAEMVAPRAQYNQTVGQVIYVEATNTFYKKNASSGGAVANLDSDYNIVTSFIESGFEGSNLTLWDSEFTGKSFAIGDMAIYEGVLYRNLTGATDGTLRPDSDTTNWRISGASQPTVLQALTLIDGTNDYALTEATLNTATWDDKYVKIISNGLEYYGIRDRDFQANYDTGTSVWTISVDGVGGDNYYQGGDVITVSNTENIGVTVSTSSSVVNGASYPTLAAMAAATPAVGTIGVSTSPVRAGIFNAGTGWAIDTGGVREWDATDAGRGIYNTMNQFVTYNGALYKKVTNTATTNNPVADSTNWKQQVFGATVYNAAGYYEVGTVVLDTTDNNFYRAINIVNDGGTVNLPSNTPANWTVVQSGGINGASAFSSYTARNAFASSNMTYNFNTVTGVATAISGGSTTNDYGWYTTTAGLFVKSAGTFVYYSPRTNADQVTTVYDANGNVYHRGDTGTVTSTATINGTGATAYNVTIGTNAGFMGSSNNVSVDTHYMNSAGNDMYLEWSTLGKYNYAKSYSVNDLVNYNGAIYKCIGTTANMTGAAGTSLPTADTTNWEPIVASGPTDTMDGVKELFFTYTAGAVTAGATTNITFANPVGGGNTNIAAYSSFDLYLSGVYVARVDNASGARRWSITNTTAAAITTTIGFPNNSVFMLVCR